MVQEGMEIGGIGAKRFAEGVIEKIHEYFSAEYADIQCEVIQQTKNNGVVRTGIKFCQPEGQTSPVIYVEPYFWNVLRGGSLDEIMRDMAGQVQDAIEKIPQIPQTKFWNYDSAKDMLAVQLVNTRANRRILAEVPHRHMEDLSLICLLQFPVNGGVGNLKVSYEFLEKWDISTDELFQTALENVRKKEEAVMKPMFSLIEESLNKREYGVNLLDGQMNANEIPKRPFCVLSNKSGSMGSSVLAYPDTLYKVSRLFPEGFYVIPSSIHEVLIISKKEGDARILGEMVRDVNQKAVAKSEVLSDRVYEYDKENDKLRQVPDSIMRGKVRER